jgi:hypothetical protein
VGNEGPKGKKFDPDSEAPRDMSNQKIITQTTDCSATAGLLPVQLLMLYAVYTAAEGLRCQAASALITTSFLCAVSLLEVLRLRELTLDPAPSTKLPSRPKTQTPQNFVKHSQNEASIALT